MVVDPLLAATTWFFVGYFFLINGSYLLLNVGALVVLRARKRERAIEPPYDIHESPVIPGIAVVLPAYNEAPVIASSVRSLLSVEYPDVEVVAVNDGSTDDTLDRLRAAFDLERVAADYPAELPCEPVRAVYRAANADLVVIDKDNGGKADALNAGVFFTDQPLFCAVDADTVIERSGLAEIVRPFLRDPERVVATGGAVRVANGCDIRDGVVERVRLSGSPLVDVQTMEYIRAFLTGRIGLGLVRSLLLISGAFGLFRTGVVREVGGYSRDTATEDMELVVRLHRHLIDEDRPYRVTFVPEAVVWTEVPESLGALDRQRSRWYRGLLESLLAHRGMIARPEYGTVGLVALPFFVLVEALGPLVEGFGYLLVPVAFALGLLNGSVFLLFLAVAVGLGTLMSWLGALSEVYGFQRHTRVRDVAGILGYGVLENVVYRQWKAVVAWKGLVQLLRGPTDWGEMTRVGFED